MANNILEKLKSQLDIDDFNNITKEQYYKILDMIQNDNFSIEQLAQVIKSIPNIVALQKDYLENLKVIVNSVKESQQDSIRVMSQNIEAVSKNLEQMTIVFSTIANNPNKDQESITLLAELMKDMLTIQKDLSNKIQEISKDNNETWKVIAKYATVAISLVGSVLLSVIVKRK